MPNVTLPPEEEAPGPGNQLQGWMQVDKAAHQAMWKLGTKHPTALVVLHFMVSKLQRGTSGVVISAAALSRQLDISHRTAQSAIAVLAKSKFVQVLKTGNTNAYIINSRVAWQGERGMRHASFNAQLVVDEIEQAKPVEELVEEAGEMIPVPHMEMYSPEEFDEVVEEVKPMLIPGEESAPEKTTKRKPRGQGQQASLLGDE